MKYGWKTRPEGAYGVVQLDFEAGNLNGDGSKLDRAWEGSVDLFAAGAGWFNHDHNTVNNGGFLMVYQYKSADAPNAHISRA